MHPFSSQQSALTGYAGYVIIYNVIFYISVSLRVSSRASQDSDTLKATMKGKKLSRRDFLRLSAMTATGLAVAAKYEPFAIYVVPLHGLLVQIQKIFGIPMLNTYWGMILPWVVYPFGIFLMRQAMFGVPDDLLDAARIDGVSTLGIFWSVVMPLVRGHVMALAIFSFIFRYNDLLWPLVVATTDRIYPVTLGLMEFVGEYFVEYGLFTAASVAVIAPIILLYIFLQGYIIQGVALTGLKG
jgi:multiple sugar transport system permease protein